jgi:hypothetical protein
MHADGLEDILKEFPPAMGYVKRVCRQMQNILFPLRQNGQLDIGTHTAADDLYSKTIEAYDVALADLLEDSQPQRQA